MRTLCLSIPDFWTAWARARDRVPAGRPLVLTVAGRVRACSPEARRSGVSPGMPARVAAARCPQALVREIQDEAPRDAWQHLLAALGKFGPLLESPREGLASLPATGLERHYRDELRLGLAVGRTVRECLALPGGIGIADGKFVAEAAATQAGAGFVVVVPPGAEHHFLQRLPVGLLPLSEECRRQLSLLGVQTLAQYTALPCDAVRSRFGRAGRDGWHWAHGVDDRPLLAGPREHSLVSTLYFDDPLREEPALKGAVERLVGALGGALRREGLACQELHLTIEPERGPLLEKHHVLREPAAHPAHLQAITLGLLAPLPGALQGLTLKLARLVPLAAASEQLDLFGDRQLAAELDSALAALTARYGDGCFQRARPLSPDSLLPEQRFALERFQVTA